MRRRRAMDAGAVTPEEALVARLREAMLARGLSQADLSRRLDVRQATVSEWFSGRLPSAQILLRLPSVLEVDGHWLLTGEGPRVRANGDAAAAALPGEYRQGAIDTLSELRALIRAMELRLQRQGAQGIEDVES